MDEAEDGLNCQLWTRTEQLGAVNAVHAALESVSMGNCHSAVKGTGGTARPSTKVSILRDLKKAHGAGGHLLDVGCSFGHLMLSALMLGYAGVCGCDLPENQEVQCPVLTNAKARLGISPGDLCEWIGSDVMDLILPEHLSRRITAVYSFWNGLSVAAQQRTLELCRRLVNVRSVAVYYVAKKWPTPEAGIITTIQFSLLNRIPLKVQSLFLKQFSEFLIKGHHQSGCFFLPSSTSVWAKESSTQHGSFIGKRKQTKRFSLWFGILSM
jgi:hypothetical protein